MNNDSIIRECAQVFDHDSAVSGGNDIPRTPAPVTNVFKTRFGSFSQSEGPRAPRSSLASIQLVPARTREEMRKMAADAWRQRGLALIDPLLINDDFARQALINEANRLYGRRASEGQVQP